MLKSRIQLEHLSGKTAVAVRPDSYARMFAITLRAAYAFPIEECIKAEYQADRKRGQKLTGPQRRQCCYNY